MNSTPIKRIPNLPENPWLTKGTAHILKSGKSVNPPQTHESIQLSKKESNYKEYSVQSKDFVSTTSPQESLLCVSQYVDSLKTLLNQMDNIKADFSVFDNYSFVGLINEGNNCYQNCIIQVLSRIDFYIVLTSLSSILFCNIKNQRTAR